MAKKKIRKSGVVLGALYIVGGGLLLVTMITTGISAISQQKEISILEKEKEKLLAEKESIEEEIELLSNDDYITRYARENYIFTKDGEKVVIIPSE